MDKLTIDASAAMISGTQDIQANAIATLLQSGLQTAKAAMSSSGNGLRAEVMQGQGIGQKVDIAV